MAEGKKITAVLKLMESIEDSVKRLPEDAIWHYYGTNNIPTIVISDVNEVTQKANHDVGVLIFALNNYFRILDPPLFNREIYDHNDTQLLTQIDHCISSTSQEYRILFVWLLQHYSVIEHSITCDDLRFLIYSRLFCGLFHLNIAPNNESLADGDLQSRVLYQVMF